MEAAEKRQRENESRGIQDPEKVKRLQQRAADTERRENEAAKYGSGGAPVLKVNIHTYLIKRNINQTLFLVAIVLKQSLSHIYKAQLISQFVLLRKAALKSC